MAAIAVDPKYEFRMTGGANPTAANINAAAGDLGLEVAEAHCLWWPTSIKLVSGLCRVDGAVSR